YDAKQKRWGEARYVAFVLAPGQKPRRVELGAAKPIEDAPAPRRKALAPGPARDPRPAPPRPVSDPLPPPPPTHTASVCPDALLSALPWGALPGAKPGTVLLEECAVALVPHGPLLLEQLTGQAPSYRTPAALLALGGVDYDRAAAPVQRKQ